MNEKDCDDDDYDDDKDNEQINDTMERTIQVRKMRGISYSDQIHLIEFNSDGLNLRHPKLSP